MKSSHPVYLVRHGATLFNEQGRFQGLIDNPLSPAGREQAMRIGQRLHALSSQHSLKQASLQCSPLKRARETAVLIADRLGRAQSDIKIASDLTEMGFGRWEGMTTLQVKATFYQERRSRQADRWNFAPCGGQSYADAAKRMTRWISHLDKPAIAVTHLGIMRAAVAVFTGYGIEEALKLEPGPLDVWCLVDGRLDHL